MLELHNKQQPVDLLTVTDALKKLNKLDDIGGIAYLTSLANVVPTAANVGYHADIVEEKSTLRQLIAGGTQIASMGFEGTGELEKSSARPRVLSFPSPTASRKKILS
jgi:replicative DNA helicase